MEQPLNTRLKHMWNIFLNKDPTGERYVSGGGYSQRPDRVRLTISNERSIITSIYNRLALDVASVAIKHVRLDQNDRYLETINSPLNQVLGVSANKDQTGRAFIQDLVLSLFDEGVVAVVPTDSTIDIRTSETFDILSARVAKIIQWYPDSVRVRLYNEDTSITEEITIPKKSVAIIENPFYAVMNEPNSTLQRLIRKLNILDAIDEQSGAGKLDLIIQLPYTIKTQARQEQAEKRRKDIEMQLSGSKYGIAYTDGTEKVTQLNRPAENNLMTQITYLTSTLYSQLGLTESIFDGTADEQKTINYFNRTIEPLLAAIVDEFIRKFLTKTARSQRQSILFFRDPFKLVPLDKLAEASDKFTRNEIMSSNEFRGIIALRPSTDPRANQLVNKNISSNENESQPIQ